MKDYDARQAFYILNVLSKATSTLVPCLSDASNVEDKRAKDVFKRINLRAEWAGIGE